MKLIPVLDCRNLYGREISRLGTYQKFLPHECSSVFLCSVFCSLLSSASENMTHSLPDCRIYSCGLYRALHCGGVTGRGHGALYHNEITQALTHSSGITYNRHSYTLLALHNARTVYECLLYIQQALIRSSGINTLFCQFSCELD